MTAARPSDPLTTADGRHFARRSFLALAGLWSLGVAQPLLEMLAAGAEFLVAHHLQGVRLVALALAVAVLPPLLLWTLERLAARAGKRSAVVVHLALVSGLFAALAGLACRALGLDEVPWLLATAVAAALLLLAYARRSGVRVLVRVLAVAAVVVPAVFLLSPRVRPLVSASGAVFGAPPTTPQSLRSVRGAETPVVWIVADEWALWTLLDADGDLDRVSYPHLAALADDATWYRRAASVSGATELAVPAMLSGRLPEPGELPVRSHFRQHLFSLLPDYEVWAEEVVSFLSPPERNQAAESSSPGLPGLVSDLRWLYLHRLLPEGLRHTLPPLTGRWTGFGAAPEERQEIFDRFLPRFRERMRRDRLQSFERFLGALGPQPGRLYFLHLLLPHTPYEYLPDGRRYEFVGGHLPGLEGERWGASQARVDQSLQRYLLQVRFLDRLVGRLVERLKQVGLYDRAVLVLVSDHGVSFRAGELRRTATADNAHELLPVPLLVKVPGGAAGRVAEEPFSLVDLLPLVLDALDAATDDETGRRPRASASWAVDRRPVDRRPLDRRPLERLPLVTADGTQWVGTGIFERQMETVRERLQRFDRPPAGRVVRPASPPEVVGRAVDEIGWREASEGAVIVESRLESPGPPSATGGPVQAMVKGRLLDPLTDPDRHPACCELALALDGTVVATVPVEASVDPVFSLVVPPPEERSELDVYRLLPPGSAVRLELLPVRRQPVRDRP